MTATLSAIPMLSQRDVAIDLASAQHLAQLRLRGLTYSIQRLIDEIEATLARSDTHSASNEISFLTHR